LTVVGNSNGKSAGFAFDDLVDLSRDLAVPVSQTGSYDV